MSKDIHQLIEEYLDDCIYGGSKYEMKDVDYATGLFRRAEDLDCLVLLSMLHRRRSNVALTMHLMSRSAELYLKSCLARHYSKEKLDQKEILQKLRKSSRGFRYNDATFKEVNGFFCATKVPGNAHSLIQLWQTCQDVLAQKYNLKNNSNCDWVRVFCLKDGDKENWYDLIYEPNEKNAWQKSKNKGLINNETHFIKCFAEDFLNKILPF